jgi:hypothetical protein
VNYLKKLCFLAKNKMTTYVALLISAFALLPDAVYPYWEQVKLIIPETYHHLILAGLGFVAIWARVRREISTPQ